MAPLGHIADIPAVGPELHTVISLSPVTAEAALAVMELWIGND